MAVNGIDSINAKLIVELQEDARTSVAELGRRVGLSAPAVAELARKTPEVVECHRVTGEDCFYMELHVRSIEELEELIDSFLVYGTTTTSIVQSSPVQRRALPLQPIG